MSEEIIQVIVSRCHYCNSFREWGLDFKLPKKGEMEDKLLKCPDCGNHWALQFQTSDKPRNFFVEKGILNKDINLKGGEEDMKNNIKSVKVNDKSSKPIKEKKESSTTFIPCCVCKKDCIIGKTRLEEMKAKKKDYVKLYTCRDCKKKARQDIKVTKKEKKIAEKIGDEEDCDDEEDVEDDE